MSWEQLRLCIPTPSSWLTCSYIIITLVNVKIVAKKTGNILFYCLLFTVSWWLYILDCTMRHFTRLSDYGYQTGIFFCYQTIELSNIGLANSRNYRTIGYRIWAPIYRTQKNYWLPISGKGIHPSSPFCWLWKWIHPVTRHVHTAGNWKGYALHAHSAGGGRG